MTIEDIRRQRLNELIAELGTVAALARLLEHNNSTQVSQWRKASPSSRNGRPRSISNDSARKIERKTGKPHGWMDAPPETESAQVCLPQQPHPSELTSDEAVWLDAYRTMEDLDRRELFSTAKYRAEMAVINREKERREPRPEIEPPPPKERRAVSR